MTSNGIAALFAPPLDSRGGGGRVRQTFSFFKNALMPDIFLHMGQGKAGSSAIQHFLFENTALLAAFGINYPRPRMNQTGLLVHYGNLIATGGYLGDWDAIILKHCRRGGDASLLFSQEHLLGQVATAPQPLVRLLSRLPARYTLRVMLYLRDPIPHFRSQYFQSIKSGFGGTLEEFLSIYNVPNIVLGCIKTLRALGVDTTIRKYRSEGLLADFSDSILGKQAQEFLARAEFMDAPVNRSLTCAEAELLRQINLATGAHLRNISWYITRPVLPQAAEIAAEQPYLSAELLARFKEKFAATVAEINELVSPAQQLSTDFNLPKGAANVPDRGVYSFNQKQLALIARGIAEVPGMSLPLRMLRYKEQLRRLMVRSRDPRRVMQAVARRLRTYWQRKAAGGG